jgi:hypothetical protein
MWWIVIPWYQQSENWKLKVDLDQSFSMEGMNRMAVANYKRQGDCSGVLCYFEGQGGEPDYECYQL